MLLRAAASAALLACAVNASAQPKPYRLATMPVLGMSLVRRDTSGYQPEQTVCGEGNTCAEACGVGYAECASSNDAIHCYNPQAQQECCSDGTGNSCDAGYYCTHDTSSQTWCCPDNMSLTECAAVYNVEGGLETPEPTTSVPVSTSTPPTTSSIFTTPEVSTTTTTTSTSIIVTSSEEYSSTETPETTSTYYSPTSSGFTSAWTGSNSTISTAVPTQPSEPSITEPTGSPTEPPSSGATANGVSALLLLAAGVVAFL